MKVISTSALPLVLLVVVCASASPMFGTGGMMKRKFPGASDMSYRTYREIVNSNARGDTPPAAGAGSAPAAGVAPATAVAARTGASGASESSWMFNNGLSTPSFSSSFAQAQPLSYSRGQTTFTQQGLPFNPQNLNTENSFLERYPSQWDPRDSYAFLEFPYYAPIPYEAYGPQKKIMRHFY